MLLICSSVGLHLPSGLGAGAWWCGISPVFSVSWHGEAMCELGCRGVRVLFLLGGFSCQMCLQHCSKIFTLSNTC
jgi:hypothetical protein